MELVVFADYVCPYCYLSDLGLSGLRREGVAVEVAAFELWPPGEVLPGADGTWLQVAWSESVAPLARELGVEMARPSFITRTRKAHESVAYARSEGMRDAMHEAVYHAYWQEGRDIGRIDVLVAIGVAVGLDATGLKVALDIDQWTARVESDLTVGTRLGLRGVPAYLRTSGNGNAELLTGLQHYDELRKWVIRDDV